MDEVELVDKVRILHVALLWAMNNYFPWHHNEPHFSEKDRHALVLFIQNDAFTFTRCNAETIKSYLQSDFHLYGLSRSALMGYSDSLKSVITADQLKRHTDNPYLFEFPEKETPFVKEFFDCRAALNWVESLREKPQMGRTMGENQADISKLHFLTEAIIITEPVEGALESHKKMSFEDYCFEQIKMMELDEQKKFVFETRQGDGLSCGYGLKWMNTYNQLLSKSNKKEIKTFKSPLSRAKERFRKLSVD